ncbi:MAG TPA: GDSL-type esterase/lipase family protein [Luteimonas sp.]|nr:GDSL-type esterase/lipase family protein [Luteimonas sp.]
MTATRATGGPLPPLRARSYLALGDSYTIGEGVDEPGRWPAQLARALRAGGVMLADPTIVATTGWTTDELWAALEAFDGRDDALETRGLVGAASAASSSTPDAQQLAAEAAPTRASARSWDFVSLLIGVNDQYRGRGVEDYRAGFAALLDRAIGYAGGNAARVLVLSIPDWGVTPFAAREGRDAARVARELDAYDAAAREECARRGVAFVDVTAISRERGAEPAMLAGDGLHPSAAMYAQWTRLALPVARGLLAR